MLYTGYYAKLKKYEEAGLVPVAVSGKVPNFFKGIEYPEFAPRWEVFKEWKNERISNEEYSNKYKKYLNTLDKEEIKFDLDSPHEAGNLILLCYEKPGDFCHRHVLADWLEENFGYKVKEYEFNNE